MTPSADYLQAVSKRLWMQNRLRDERLEELASHIESRELERGLPFTSVDAVASVMGTPQSLATEMNRSVPWQASRPAMRLYLTPLWMLAAGYLVSLLLALLLHLVSSQAVFFLSLHVNTFVLFGVPVGVALSARRLCVRPLHAALPLAFPMLLASTIIAFQLMPPSRHTGLNVFFGGLSVAALVMQFVALLAIGFRPLRINSAWFPVLLLLPIVPMWIAAAVATCLVHGAQTPLWQSPLISALVTGAAIAIPAWMMARSLRHRGGQPVVP